MPSDEFVAMDESAAGELEIRIPDIGDFDDVEIVEVLVSIGDRVEIEDSLVTLESDKATMEIPAPVAGTVSQLKLAVGDRVSEGSLVLVLTLEAKDAKGAKDASAPAPKTVPETGSKTVSEPKVVAAESERPPVGSAKPPTPAPKPPPAAPVPSGEPDPGRVPHASPLVRGFARQLGVDLRNADGSGPAGRISLEDVRSHVRGLSAGAVAAGDNPPSAIPVIPPVDFSKFGPVEEVKLAKLRRVAARNLHRSWLNVPHVTQHDEADITELEAFRKSRSADAKERGLRLSPLLFLLKAVVISLRRFPDFRSSLSPDSLSLIRKNYFHIGVAVDTEQGLVVPVLRDVDQKSIYQLSAEISELAEKARARKLGMGDMQGAVFTISSLGGIGGTAFTPIVNAPEVAILGVSRTVTRPLWIKAAGEGEGQFEPRQVLPLSLSYDHRVIDGASAVRFTSDLCHTLSDPLHLLG